MHLLKVLVVVKLAQEHVSIEAEVAEALGQGIGACFLERVLVAGLVGVRADDLRPGYPGGFWGFGDRDSPSPVVRSTSWCLNGRFDGRARTRPCARARRCSPPWMRPWTCAVLFASPAVYVRQIHYALETPYIPQRDGSLLDANAPQVGEVSPQAPGAGQTTKLSMSSSISTMRHLHWGMAPEGVALHGHAFDAPAHAHAEAH